MNNNLLPVRHISRELWCAILGAIAIVLFVNCGDKHSKPERSTAEAIWIKAESQDRTNDVKTAYPLLLDAQTKLKNLSEERKGGLNYNFCLAILSSRLFIMSKALGDTNASAKHLAESAFYWNEDRRFFREPPTNYSAEAIEAIIKRYDSKVHDDVSTTPLHGATNSPAP